MTRQQFNDIVTTQLQKCKDLLIVKGQEYASDNEDRLIAFKTAATLQHGTPKQALAGMMAKHTTSIYDMIDADKDFEFSLDMWDEKITDHINYLLLLKALVREGRAAYEQDTN